MSLQRHPSPAPQAGFTLLELLVSLAVVGFVSLSLSQGLNLGLQAWLRADLRGDQRADIEATERLFRDLIRGADPGLGDLPAPFQGQPHALALVTRLPVAALGGMKTRDADVALGVDAAHRLVLRSAPRPHAERLASEPAEELVLLRNVDHIDLRYLAASDQGGAWSEQWTEPLLPRLVRLTLVFPKRDPRRWPSIEAAPALSHVGS